ncbi:LacI family DNA-binding transcriptional regulator [Pediococcus argentinicus]|uniref:LacI family DNA-binding transcriptional regulator n=1 Tax=Pediococcus argentinicus TaxID=480391 RepID=UPI00338F9683
MAKLSDVAKKAGVSVTTVSRVINNYGSLSEKTKNAVFTAMHELNYQPNSLARSLQGKQTKLVGVIFPSITNPFYAELIADIEDKLFKNGYKVILCNANENAEKELSYLRMLTANQVDGIIVGTHSNEIKEYQTMDLPVVSFDRTLGTKIPTISSDNFQGAQLAAQELVDSGATNIYFIGKTHLGSAKNPTDLREKGFAKTLEQNSLEPHYLDLNNDLSNNIKKMKIRDFLTNTPTVDGVFTSDDFTALLVMEVAQDLGIEVPSALKVIGFDGTQLIQSFHPELSTIAQPIQDIAELLIGTLDERINKHKEFENAKLVLPNKLIKSNSTQK